MTEKSENKNIMKRFKLGFALLFLLIWFQGKGQSTFTGTGNWSDPARWSAGVPNSSIAAIIETGANCTIDISGATCASLSFNANNANSVVTISGTNDLTVNGAISFSDPSADGFSQTVSVGDGSLVCGSISMANTSNGTRTNNININSGSITVNGNVTLNGANNENYLVFSGTGTGTVTGNVTGTGRIDGGGSTINISGNFTGFTFNAGTSTVNFNGAGAQNVGVFTYYNLSTNNGGTKTLTGATIINNILTLNRPLDVNTRTLTLNSATAQDIQGTPTNLITAAGSTLIYNGNGGAITIPVSVTALTGLTINNTSGVSLGANLTTLTTLILQAGVLDNSVYNISMAAAGNITRTTGSLSTALTTYPTTLNLTYNCGTSITTGYEMPQTATIPLNNLTINTNSTNITLADYISTINMSGNLAMANTSSLIYSNTTPQTINVTGTFAGTTLNMSGGNQAHNLNLSNTMTLTTLLSGTGSTITLQGTVAQILPGLSTYNNVTLSNSGAKSIAGAATIGGTLTLNQNLTLGNFNLTLNTNGTIAGTFGSSAMIITNGSGSLIKQDDNASDFQIIFPVGNGTNYSPLEISSLTGTVTPTASIGVRSVASIHPSTAPVSNILNKYWTVSTTNLSGLSVNGSFYYNDPAEVTGSDASFVAQRYSTLWNADPELTVNSGADQIILTGATTLTGDFTAAEVAAFVNDPNLIVSVAAGAWDVAANWSPATVPNAATQNVYIRHAITASGSARTINNLTISSSGSYNAGAQPFTIGGNLLVEPGGSLTAVSANFTISGTATNNGTFTDSNVGGVTTFTGALTNNGTFTSTAANTAASMVFSAGINNSGTFTAGGATFNASQTISGSGAISFANPVTISGAVTLTNDVSNANGLIIIGNLDGTLATSTFKNNDNRLLEYRGANAPMITNNGYFDVSAAGNTVYYNLNGAQTIRATTYNNLRSNQNTKTLEDGSITVNGDLTITGGILQCAATTTGILTVNGNVSNAGTLTLRRLVVTPMYSNITINGNSITGNGTYTFNDIAFGGGTVTWSPTTNINIYGNFTDNTTTSFTSTAGSFYFLAPVSQNLGGTSPGTTTFNAFQIGAAATDNTVLILNRNLTTTNITFNVSTTGALNLNDKTLIINGNHTRTSNGKFTGSANSVITINGSGNPANNLLFDATTPGTTNYLKSFTSNRAAAGNVILGNDLYVGDIYILQGTVTTGFNLTVFGDFINNATFNQTANTITFDKNGTQSITTTGTPTASTFFNFVQGNSNNPTINADISFNVGGNFTQNSSNPFSAGAGTTTFNSAGAQAIQGPGSGNINFYNLTIAGGNVKTADISFGVNNNLTVSSTLSFGTTVKTITVSGNLSGGGTINMTGVGLAHVFNLGGATNTITNFNTTPTSGSTVNYNRSDDQTVFLSANYQNLNLLGAGVKTFGAGTTTISGNLDVTNSTLAYNNIAARIINVTGNLSGNGTIDMRPGNQTHTLNLGGVTNSIGNLSTVAVASTINYNRAGDQTVFASPNYRNLTISGSGVKTMQGNIDVGGNLSVSSTTATLDLGTVANGFNVTGTSTITGGLNFGGTTSKTMVATGTFSMNNAASVLDMSGNTDHHLHLRGTTVYTAGATFTAGTDNQTVYYDGDIAQTMLPVTYNHLVIDNYNASTVTARVKTIGAGTTLVNGNLIITGVGAVPTVTLQVGGNNLTVNGQTTINAYGVFNDNALAGTNIFADRVTINANGQWVTTNNPPFTFNGGLTFNGSLFTSGTGNYTFNTNDQTIEGGQSFTITNIVTTGVSLTNRHTALTASTISGTGNFTNGDTGFNATLYVTGANPFSTLSGTLDLNSNPNTVNYSSGAAQTIGAYNFYNLSSSGAGARTLQNSGTIGIYGDFNKGTNAYTVTGSTVNFNGTADQTIPAFTFNNLTISGGSIKTISGAVSLLAAGVLNLVNGILELDGFNLTINNNAANAIQGVFGSGNMISTNGAGYLVKNAATLQSLFPIGSGGYYSPMTLTAINPTTGTLSVRAVPSALNPSYINKYWDITSSVVRTSATATFQYDPAELNNASQNISYSPDWGTTWQSPPTNGTTSFGTNSFTITGNNPFAGWWTMGYKTFYSYQTGSWGNPTTWTTDPSGTLQIGTSIPGFNDKVVILTGRTISLSSDIATQSLDITIDDGGFLDMGTFRFTNSLKALSGEGTLKLASVNFPSALTNSLILANGGTVEYNAGINLPVTPTTYNNLTINTSGTVVQLNNLTLFGSLSVTQGTFQINDNTATRRQLIINGNVTVGSSGSILVGTGVTNTTTDPLIPSGVSGAGLPYLNYYELHSHRVVVYGDFTNEGTVRFTNLSHPIYNAFPSLIDDGTTGFATVYFRGASNNTLTCNGTTDFYNLVVDKGTDQTYMLTISTSDYPNFRLFGANIAPGENAGANPYMKKALWLKTGTLVLDGFIVIPSLTEGTDGLSAVTSDFYIPTSAALVIDDSNVALLVTADDYQEVNAAYGVSGGTGLVNGISQGTGNALQVLGSLEVRNGYLSTRESAGILYSDTYSGQVIISGGTVDTKQFRPITGNGLITYTQSGGELQLRGRMQRTPSAFDNVDDLVNAPVNNVRANEGTLRNDVGTFSINNSLGVFTMSSGTIRIYDAPDDVNRRAFDIFSSSSNYNVTGGTLVLEPIEGSTPTDASPWLISSNAPIGNLTVNRVSGSSVVQLETGFPLTVLKNFIIQSGDFDANNLNVTIGGNFTIQAGTTYTPGTNTTSLNGTAAQTFTINLAAALSLNNFTISKPAGSAVTFAGSQKTLDINGNFRLENGTLNDNGNTINLMADVYNSGVHNGTGKIALIGDAAQTISGNGSGVFRNLELNKPTDGAINALVTSNFSVNGTLTFSGSAAGYKRLNMQSYKLTMGSSATVVGADLNRYVLFDGNFGDGGIAKTFSGTSTSFTFPLATVHPTVNYTPATISIGSAPTIWGTITVTPVKIEHPNTTTKDISLKYFWKVRSSGFSGLAAGSVTHSYSYSEDDVVADEADYIPARYDQNSTTWATGTTASVDEGNNIIGDPWLTNTDYIDGDYTAGDATPTSPFGAPTTYYSRQGGLWDDMNTWSLTNTNNHNPADNPPAGSIPGAGNIVVIGGNDSVYLATNLTVPNTGARSCATLMIETGSALDNGYNPASNFSVVRSHPNGNGNFRVACDRGPLVNTTVRTFEFPLGDFSDFNVNTGTTELYTTNPLAGTTFYLPNGVLSYGNLILSPLGGSNIIFANNDLTVYGNLVTRGQNSLSWFCPTWGGDYPTAPITKIAKTITVLGNLRIEGGALIWIGNGSLAQDFIVHGDVFVNEPAGIGASAFYGAVTNQSLSIGGSLINNSLAPAGGNDQYRGCDLNVIPATFFGTTNASITNTNTLQSPYTRFSTVTVNKGTSQSTTLTVNIGGTLTTPTDNWLTLQTGTLVYQRTGNLTISTTTPFTIQAQAGLTVNTTSNVLISNINTNTGDLFLNGKLTIISGNVSVGRVGNNDNNNNDIEYSGGGSSALDIRGGSLFVNGQIRRNSATTSGILNYTQSGGTVVINGQAQLATRAKLEVLNTGSRFNMSGGTLAIVRGSGTTFGDLYLRPEFSSVTGGEIIFTQVPSLGLGVDAVQTYSLDANIALNNLTITGKIAATARNATLNLMVSPLVLKGSLTLTNNRSFFVANNQNVTLMGDLINNNAPAAYTYGNNTTTFNGGTQNISGTAITNFNNLVVNPTSSLTVNNSFTVNGYLTISRGNLALSGFRLRVLGNLTNNGSYTDSNAEDVGIWLNGSVQQQIAGTGSFGRLEIDNTQGAKINNDIILQNNLEMTQGNLDINQYLLSLGVNSNLLGTSFGLTKMIISQGVSSIPGMRKFFGIFGTTQNFTFPIGVSGKYTPAEFTLDQNATVGFIGVNPVNSSHPTVSDPNNVLKYYWNIESSGVSNLEGNILLHYLSSDVLGTESDYVAAQLLSPGAYWSKASPGAATDNVDETSHQITFNISSGTNNLTGDYTAGSDAALPDEVPSYITISDGNWSDETIWAPQGSSPPCPVGGPSGYNVTIEHEVTTDVNYCFAYRTTINGRLKVVSPSFGHNIGTVDGIGTLYVESGNLPAGIYDQFVDCTNIGTIEYGGTGNYTVLATQFNSAPNLLFSGSGTRTLPNKDLTVCNSLVINGPTLDNNTYKKKLTILGTMERYNTGAFIAGTGSTAIVSFAGTLPQTLGGPTGDFTGANAFYNLEIDNPLGLTIGNNGNIEIYGILKLTNGVINTTTTNRLTIVNTSAASVSPSGGTSTSYVSGPLIKRILNGGSFLYPLGKDDVKGHPFTLTSTTGSTQYFTSEFFTPNPWYNALTDPLLASNTGEYWNVNTTANRTAKVKIGWDSESELTPAMTQNGLTDMRVAEYNTGTSKWVELTSTATGTSTLGDVATVNNVTVTVAGKQYTSASITTTKPRAAFNPTGPVCGTAGIPVRFTSFNPISLNYTLDYTIDGVPQTQIVVTALPYTLPTPTPGAYQLTAFTYNNGAGTDGLVSSSVVNVYSVPTTADAGIDQSICGVSNVTLNGNDPSPFTGLWTIRSGSGGNIITPTAYNSDFIGVLGNTYVLRWTISSGGCTSYDEVNVSFPVAPQKPSNFTTGPYTVCQGATVTYTVPAAPSTTYNWSYSGDGADINGMGNPVSGIGNSVPVYFNTSATSGVISVTATNACGTSTPRTRNVTITPLPGTPGLITGDNVVCQGESGVSYQVPAITNATGYIWTLPSGASIASGANTNSITVNYSGSASSGNITVTGTNSCGSGPVSDIYPVLVNLMPTITPGANPSICKGTSPAMLNYSATTNSPDLYSINFDAAAETENFVDVVDAALPISPIIISTPLTAAAGTYNATLVVKNSGTGCISGDYSITVTILPLPTSVITGLASPAVICEGEEVDINIVLTGQTPFEFTIEDDHGGSWTVNTPDNNYTFIVPLVDRPVWVAPDLPTVYKYIITSMNDGNGCFDVTPTGEAEVSVYKIPETGPQYHVPNNFGL